MAFKAVFKRGAMLVQIFKLMFMVFRGPGGGAQGCKMAIKIVPKTGVHNLPPNLPPGAQTYPQTDPQDPILDPILGSIIGASGGRFLTPRPNENEGRAWNA